MSNYAILRTAKIKTAAKIFAADMHNSRQWATANAAENGKVYELLAARKNKSCLDLYNENLTKYNIKPRANGVLAIEYLATFSPDMRDKISVKEWANKNLEFFKKQHPLGLLSVQLHLDETTPHMHIIAMPLIEKTAKNDTGVHLSARDFLGGKAKMIALQTRYASAMKDFGLDRGMRNSVASHNTVKEFYKELDQLAKKSIDESKKDLPDGNIFNIKNLYSSAKEQIKKLAKLLSAEISKTKKLAEKVEFFKAEAAHWKFQFQHNSTAKAVDSMREKVEKLEEENKRLCSIEYEKNMLEKRLRWQSETVQEQEQKIVNQSKEIEALKNPRLGDHEHSY